LTLATRKGAERLFPHKNASWFLLKLLESGMHHFILLHLELLPPPLDTGESNNFNQKKRRNASAVGAIQILIGQRVLESGN
jgi:hypothetical protein